MRCLAPLVSLLLVSLCEPALLAQTLTYTVDGQVTSVPRCVTDVFSEGDRWTLEQIIDLPPPVEETETPAADADDDDDADVEGKREGDDGTRPDAEVEPEDAESAPDGDASLTDAEAAPAGDGTDPDAEAPIQEEFTLTKHHPAIAFSWTIGDVSGTATGVSRVFVSNDHLGQDSIAWQALDYSAAFEPSRLGDTGIRGIQAGLADATSSVFESTDLPDELERTRFAGEGFFQVFFRTKCGYFRNNPLTGSVSSAQVRWDPSTVPEHGNQPLPDEIEPNESEVHDDHPRHASPASSSPIVRGFETLQWIGRLDFVHNTRARITRFANGADHDHER